MPDPKLDPLLEGGDAIKSISESINRTGKWTANDCIDVKFTEVVTMIMQENIPFLRKFTLKSEVKFHDMCNLHVKIQNIKKHLCWLSEQNGALSPEEPVD